MSVYPFKPFSFFFDMNSFSWIGSVSLNLSFVLYLVVYIPQILHNQKITNLAQLSLCLHYLLLFSYAFDLLYGFSSHLPWQYKTVSVVGLFLVTVQHIQLIIYFTKKRLLFFVKLGGLVLLLTGISIAWFFMMMQAQLSSSSTLISGVIARACGLIYCFPQIIKNKRSKTAHAISLKFVYLNLTVAFLDSISAWVLDWGWPNKLAAPINILLMLVLMYQTKRYKQQPILPMLDFRKSDHVAV